MPIRTLAFAAVLAIATATAAEAKVWSQHFTVDGRAEVRVVADDAHVRIRTVADTHDINVQVSYYIKKWGLVLGTHEPAVKIERQGKVIRVSAPDPRGIVTLGGVSEEYEVLVTMPIEGELSVRTGDGAIECEPVHGSVRLETGDGRVTARGLQGDIILMSGDGRLTADALDGHLRATSGDGPIRVEGRFDALDLRTRDGRLEAVAHRGSKLTQAWTIETGDGGIQMHVPSDLKARLDLQTKDGSITVDLPIQPNGRLRSRELLGDLNGGGAPLRMRSGDGSITLRLSE